MVELIISNAYVGNKRRPEYRRALAADNAHALMVCEAQKVGQIPGYRRHSAPAWASRHAREVAVYMRAGIPIDGVSWFVVTEHRGGYSHPRPVVEVRCVIDGQKWALISVHANPSRGAAASQENAKLMREVRRMCRAARKAGYAPVPAGDWNRRVHETGNDGPVWLAKQLGGRAHLYGVDGLVAVAGVKVQRLQRRPNPPGSDHPWARVVVTRRRRLPALRRRLRGAQKPVEG